MKMRNINVGKRYKHFKGHIVEVILIAKDTETLEDLVVYKHIDKNEFWVRTYKMFNSFVDKEKYPNAIQTYRFEEVEQK